MMTAVARRRTLRTLVLALGMAALMGGIAAAPALADDHWRHDRGWREHEWRRHHPHPVAVYPAPAYAYAPPPVIYAPPPPPPVVYAPPGLNIVVPLHIH